MNPLPRMFLKRRMLAVLSVLFLNVGLGLGQRSTQADTSSAAGNSWPLWNSYKAHFVDPGGRVIDRDAGDRTTSEGQAYAMFFALVANDRDQFDRLLRWTTENLAQGDLTAHLPAWEWGHAPDGTWRVLDANSAADADLWTSYTLIQAGRLWNGPRYRSLGLALARQISRYEARDLPGLGWTLLPATQGFEIVAHAVSGSPAKDTWVLNPSYSPLPVLTGLAQAEPNGPWHAMATGLPGFVTRSSVHGFAMDWVDYRADGSFQPTVLPGAPKEASPVGSYDAVRVYLWAGLAPASMPGAGAVLQSVLGMQRYLADHPVPPRIVDARGQVAAADGPVGFSAALLPYLAALRARRSLTEQQDRLAALFDPATHLYGSPPRYYDQVLALFAEGCQQRRYCFSAEGDLHTGWNAGPMRGNRNRHTLSTQSQAREIP